MFPSAPDDLLTKIKQYFREEENCSLVYDTKMEYIIFIEAKTFAEGWLMLQEDTEHYYALEDPLERYFIKTFYSEKSTDFILKLLGNHCFAKEYFNKLVRDQKLVGWE